MASMRLTCSHKDLNYALSVVSLAVSPSTTLPVLNNILLKATNKNLLFSATNLEIAINFSIPADVKNEGGITVPAKLITNYVGLLQDDQIELRVEDALTLHLKSKSSQTKIKAISPDEFPVIPKIEKEVSLLIKVKDLAEAINCTIFSAAPAGTRPVLTGVFVRAEKDVLKMVATDSFRLAEKKVPLAEKTAKSIECIIPVRTLLELGRILSGKDGDETVEIQISKNQILFMVGGVELISRLIEGKFPEYEKIIPRTARTKLEVSVGNLSMATKRVILFAKENSNSIKLSATNDGKMQILTDETSVGEERAEIDVKIEGENNRVALNAQYLLDVLGHLTDRAQIELDEKLTPIIVRSAKKDDYLYVIMPLKV